MQAQPKARGLATRIANKEKRRDRILACAAELISSEGLDALTLAKLADKAGVTIPTVHNLLGKRQEILQALVSESMAEVMKVGTANDSADPIATVERFAENLIDLFAGNESLYRAAFLAGERVKYFEHDSETGIFSRSMREATRICRDALKNGQLQGRISTKQVAYGLFASQRLSRQDWMNGYIDLETYRTQLQVGMFVALSADAAPPFKAKLVRKIKATEKSSRYSTGGAKEK